MKAVYLLDEVVTEKYRPFAEVVVSPARGFHRKLRENEDVPDDDDNNTVFIKVNLEHLPLVQEAPSDEE